MQRPGGWRGSAALTLALVLVAAATVVLLDRFARHEFTVHLRGQAARALALAATAATMVAIGTAGVGVNASVAAS